MTNVQETGISMYWPNCSIPSAEIACIMFLKHIMKQCLLYDVTHIICKNLVEIYLKCRYKIALTCLSTINLRYYNNYLLSP